MQTRATVPHRSNADHRKLFAELGFTELPEKPSAESGYRYATPFKTNDIDNWLASDGPKNTEDIADLREAICTKSLVGKYVSGEYEVERPNYKVQRVYVAGPTRTLVMKPKGLATLHMHLLDMASSKTRG